MVSFKEIFSKGCFLKDCCFQISFYCLLWQLIEVEGARLLENENQFSSCDVLLPEPSLSYGTGGQVRHLKVKRPNVAHRLPRGKRATWNGNQLQKHL
jgi:hypothetical protein